jgi:glycosyltransferase involved in cell wall biosynthesis
MLVILSTHPIQYQVPVWQAVARDGRVPFEVWYLSDHGVRPSADREFGKTFAWDIDLLSGYPHRFLDGAAEAKPGTFWGCRLHGRLSDQLRRCGASALWIQGWQVAAYWQAARHARAAGVELWLRGESNDLTPTPLWKRPIKRLALGYLFSQVDRFFTIGAANKRLYKRFGVADALLYPAPYSVDNARFAQQAEALRPQRLALRRHWGIADDAFCVLFCGKLIAKKRPMDLVRAAGLLATRELQSNLHLLFAGAGELGGALRDASAVVTDAEAAGAAPPGRAHGPKASFAGFLNQTEISRAYVAADCLVLPSDSTETWGLVVNEAMASGLPCIVSNACGCAEDLVAPIDARLVFRCGDVADFGAALDALRNCPKSPDAWTHAVAAHDFRHTIASVVVAAAQDRPVLS